MVHLSVTALIGLVTLTFDLWPFDLATGACYCTCDGQLSYQLWCFWYVSFSTFRHLSDVLRDLTTWRLTSEVMALNCRWYGSFCFICVPSLKFVGLPVWKIWHILDLSINRPGDLWPFDLALPVWCTSMLPILGFLGLSVLELDRGTRQTDSQTALVIS